VRPVASTAVVAHQLVKGGRYAAARRRERPGAIIGDCNFEATAAQAPPFVIRAASFQHWPARRRVPAAQGE
jgi:hypothetical protein